MTWPPRGRSDTAYRPKGPPRLNIGFDQNAVPAPRAFEPGDSSPAWMVRAARVWYILRYHRPSQLARRLASIVRRKWLRITGARRYADPTIEIGLRENGELLAWARGRSTARGPECAANARACLDGRFRFLNVERRLSDPIDWRLSDWPDAPHLWRFHLHYHDFLRDLGAEGLRTGSPEFSKRAWELAVQWNEANPVGDPRGLLDAWHPYCISRRLPVWIELWLTAPPARDRDRVLDSMCRQAFFLADHLEFDLGGNHLLENLRALILAGVFFGGHDGDRWLRRGASLLADQLDEQILEHGEHFERSPMYHAQMLDAVLDVAEATASLAPETARRCDEAAQGMASFLGDLLHPDGDIPLLGDSGFDPATEPAHLIERAARIHARIQGKASGPAPASDPAADRTDVRTIHPPSRRGSEKMGTGTFATADFPGFSPCPLGASPIFPQSRRVGDYWIYRHRDDFLLLDAGPVCPDHLPAHGHADLLQLEASWRGRRLFVDSGVFNYQDDSMRRYCRSTAAHNVLQIDGRDQCDVWSRFRMGYRGWPSGLAHGQAQGFHWARAAHNAYRRLGVPRVERWLACRPDGPWLCIDRACGRGEHELTSWLHLHPDVRATQRDEQAVDLELHGMRLQLRYLSPGRVSVVNGWYCPEFGKRIEAPVLCWSARERLPACCGWALSWGEEEMRVRLDGAETSEPVLAWVSGQAEYRLLPFGER
jgi:uncharacterized heparinase superfamily protein